MGLSLTLLLCYRLKEKQIFSYGILDGYNGTWSVDLMEQCLLSHLYFDHLQSLEIKKDDEIFSILRDEFEKADQTLKANINDVIMRRSELTLTEPPRKNSSDYLAYKRKLKELDEKISSGAFAITSLIVDNRLFVCNVGPSHCFLCVHDPRTYEKRVVSLDTDHSLSSIEEMMRLADLKADVNSLSQSYYSNDPIIRYTRCLGDFKLKMYYHEFPQFK